MLSAQPAAQPQTHSHTGPPRCLVSGHMMKWAWPLASHLHVEPKLPGVLPCHLGLECGSSMRFIYILYIYIYIYILYIYIYIIIYIYIYIYI